MIDLNYCNEWQHRDPETGLVFPWYTKSFLDELVTWDLSGMKVFEYGAGASTLWWKRKCKDVYAVESNEQFLEAVRAKVDDTGIYFACTKENYLKFITKPGMQFDIVVVDGEPIEWRDDCIVSALQTIKPGGRLIIDNWDQPSVWIPSDETRALLGKYPVKIYKQKGHPDWQTAVFLKTGEMPTDPTHELNRYVGNYGRP